MYYNQHFTVKKQISSMSYNLCRNISSHVTCRKEKSFQSERDSIERKKRCVPNCWKSRRNASLGTNSGQVAFRSHCCSCDQRGESCDWGFCHYCGHHNCLTSCHIVCAFRTPLLAITATVKWFISFLLSKTYVNKSHWQNQKNI